MDHPFPLDERRDRSGVSGRCAKIVESVSRPIHKNSIHENHIQKNRIQQRGPVR